MICADIEKIYRERGIPDKYVLTMILAERSRQLSERKGTGLGYEEKFITKAMEDIEQGRINFKITPIDRAQDAVTEKESVEAE